jgi:hypothetical protein
MATPKIHIDNSKLLKRMERYQEVTGKQVAATMRRGARLLAVNLATSAPPYGKDIAARKLGEKAVQNDILRVFTPATPIKLKHPSSVVSFSDQVGKYVTRNPKLKEAILSAIKASNQSKLSAILSAAGGFSKLVVGRVDTSLYKSTRNNYGRVRKGWQGRNIVMPSSELKDFISAKQDLVGMTKAAWAAAAMKVNADVKDALSGIPAWVKRHVDKVPSAVIDQADASSPDIKLVSKLPWADKAVRKADHAEAIRISREKFYHSMQREIRACLKAEQVVSALA